jgi:serine/threonine protein kinase
LVERRFPSPWDSTRFGACKPILSAFALLPSGVRFQACRDLFWKDAVMTTTELGACEWFVWDLRRSNLMDRGQLDQVILDFLKKEPRAEPNALAQYLVDQEILTPFQAQRLLHGKTHGLVLGPYTLMDALGSGSMGTVYKAQSKNDNQWYAVKVLPRRSMWNVRIARRQVRSFEQIRHPAVVPFTDVGTAGSTHYLAWPLVEGDVLEGLVQQNGKLPADVAALFGLQTAEGLEVCHQHGIIHGLLKPSNLMVGTDQQIRILDFGIGALLANNEGESLVDTMSTANTVTSGLDCSSPETILDPTNRTPAGDQYSLGCVLYYCLTGRYPFPEGTAVEKMMAHQSKQAPKIRDLVPEVPEALAAVVDRLMQKTPQARFERMIDAIEALQPLAAKAPPRLAKPMVRKSATSPEPLCENEISPMSATAGPGEATTDTPVNRDHTPPPNLPTRQSLRQDTAAVVPARTVDKRGAQTFQLEDLGRPRGTSKLLTLAVVAGVAVVAAGTWLLSMYIFQH